MAISKSDLDTAAALIAANELTVAQAVLAAVKTVNDTLTAQLAALPTGDTSTTAQIINRVLANNSSVINYELPTRITQLTPPAPVAPAAATGTTPPTATS